MDLFNLESKTTPRVLGTDLDGTFIPLPESPENVRDLGILTDMMAQGGRETVFATGRHFESVLEAIDTHGLPTPEWMVCDVGSSVYRASSKGYELYQPYADHLGGMIGQMNRDSVELLLKNVDGMELQEKASQGPFKISYFTNVSNLKVLTETVAAICDQEKLPFTCMSSVDPFTDVGLIDLLPAGVSKAFALIWLSTHADFRPEELVYAGDSGNDYAALVAGFRSIAVGNMEASLVQKIQKEMAAKNASDRFYAATEKGTSGVLEGCRHFGLVGN